MKKLITSLLLIIGASLSSVAQVEYSSSGGGGAYTINYPANVDVLTPGLSFTFKANHPNAGAATLSVNGLAAVGIKKGVGADLDPNDISLGLIVTVVYDGTNFQMITAPGNLGGGSSAAGNDGELQFNDGGTFGASPKLHWDNTNGFLGVGMNTPQGIVHVADPTVEVILTTADNVNNPELIFERAATATTTVVNGDDLGELRFYGFDGALYEEAARIKVEVADAAGVGNMPGQIHFYTTPTGSTTPEARMGINQLGHVGIGNVFPDDLLDLESEDGADINITTISATEESSVKLKRAGAGESLVVDNEKMGDIKFYGFDGADYQKSASIEVDVDGTAGAGSMPSRMQFYTTPIGTIVSERRMTIFEDGSVGINTTSTSAQLDMHGDFNMQGMVAAPGISSAGEGKIYFDGSTGKFKVSESTGGWVDLVAGGGSSTAIQDGDGDTEINVEASPDQDVIHFNLGDNTGYPAAEYFTMIGPRLEVINAGESVFIGPGAGQNDDLSNNQSVFIGHNAGLSNTSGYWNTAIGHNSFTTGTTAQKNTAIGVSTLQLAIGDNNTAVGFNSLGQTTSSDFSTGLGSYALYNNTTGSFNTAVGGNALYSNLTGNNSTVVGYQAFANTDAGNNTGLGFNVGASTTTGVSNTFVGYNAGNANIGGGYNTIMGSAAGDVNTTGSNNVLIGYNSETTSAGLSNAIAIGSNSEVGQSNAMVLGGTGANAVDVGIGTTTPNAGLHIVDANTDNTKSQMIIEADNAGGAASYAAIEFRSNFTSASVSPSGRIMTEYASPSFVDAKMIFQTISGGPSFVNTMTLTNGRVGIGTTTPSSDLTVEGSRAGTLLEISGSMTLSEGDYAVVYNQTGGFITVTLPPAASCAGRLYHISRIPGSAIVQVAPSGGDLLNNVGSNYVIQNANNNQGITVMSNGSAAWYIISEF